MGSITSTILICNIIELNLVAEDKKVFIRERSNKLYSVLSYFMAKVLGEIPVFFICVNFFIVVTYFSTNLNDTYIYKYYAFSK